MESHIAVFITAFEDYLKNTPLTNENIDNALDQLLQSKSPDLNNENLTLFSYYFHCLYWLLQSLTNYNDTAAKCVDILVKLSSKDNIRKRLIKTLFFTPLCNFLSDSIPKEDKYKLLKLIDQLSVDMRIIFLPENIHKTLNTLSTWVLNQNEAISSISLQILANICYKNENIKHIFCNSANFKSLYKYCIEEMNNSTYAKKLLIVCKSNENLLPQSILKLSTYVNIFECIQNGNIRTLRDSVDIFFDIRNLMENGLKSLNSDEFQQECKFIEYLENTPRDTVTGAQLAAETLRFLRLLVTHNIPALLTAAISVRLVNVALIWCSIGNAELIYNMDCAQIESILLLLAITNNIKKIEKNGKSVLKELTNKWSVLDELIPSVMKSSVNNENTALHLALLRLMRSCIQTKALKTRVVEIYESLDLTGIFNVPASQQNSSKSLVSTKDTFFDGNDSCRSVEQRLLLVYTAALLIDICQSDDKCHKYTETTVREILAHAHVLNVLSQVLLSKNEEEGAEVKSTILSIIRSGYVPLIEFGKILMEIPVLDSKIEPIKQIHFPETNATLSTSASFQADVVISKLQSMLRTGNMDVYTEEIILLYSLKLTQAKNSELLAKEYLSAQSKTLSQLEQRIKHYDIDADRMTRLTVMREKSLKVCKREINDLKENADRQDKKIESAEKQCTVINSKFNESLYQIEQLKKGVLESKEEKENCKRKHDEEIVKYQCKIRRQEKESFKLSKEIEELNSNAENLKKSNEGVQNNLQHCEEELNKKNQICAQRLKELIEIQKEKEALALKISGLQTNLDAINKILHGK